MLLKNAKKRKIRDLSHIPVQIGLILNLYFFLFVRKLPLALFILSAFIPLVFESVFSLLDTCEIV